MKLYEEIYIPCEDNDVEAIGMVDGPYAKTFPIKCQLDVVVITIEELKKVWEAAEKRILAGEVSRNHKGDYLGTNPDFKSYLSSKGIELK